LLKATSLAAATDALVRVKWYYPHIDMVKFKGGADAEKDFAALELELREFCVNTYMKYLPCACVSS
jgi:hypothetical protein